MQARYCLRLILTTGLLVGPFSFACHDGIRVDVRRRVWGSDLDREAGASPREERTVAEHVPDYVAVWRRAALKRWRVAVLLAERGPLRFGVIVRETGFGRPSLQYLLGYEGFEQERPRTLWRLSATGRAAFESVVNPGPRAA